MSAIPKGEVKGHAPKRSSQTLSPDVRRIFEIALEDAWRELDTDDSIKPRLKGKLRTTIVALAAGR